MLDSLFIHRVTAIRFKPSGQSNMGEVQHSKSYIPSNSSTPTTWDGTLRCRIERYQANTQYREAGERAKNQTIIYMPITNPVLELRDEIYENNVYIGLVFGINPALKAFSTDLDHYEYILDNP